MTYKANKAPAAKAAAPAAYCLLAAPSQVETLEVPLDGATEEEAGQSVTVVSQSVTVTMVDSMSVSVMVAALTTAANNKATVENCIANVIKICFLIKEKKGKKKKLEVGNLSS